MLSGILNHQALFFLLLFFLPTQLGKHFWPDFAFIIGRRIDYLSPTVFLTDILIVAIIVLWLWEKWNKGNRGNKGRQRFFSKTQIAVGASLLLFLFLNIIFAQNQLVVVIKAAKILELFVLGLYIVDTKPKLPFFSLALSLSVLYSCIIALLQFFFQRSLGGFLWFLGERSFTSSTAGIAQASLNGQLVLRPYATFSHPNVLAGYLVVIFPLLFFAKHQTKAKKYIYILAMTMSLIVLSVTMSRLAWLVFAFVFFAMASVSFKRLLFSNAHAIVFMTLFAIGAFFASFFTFRINEFFTNTSSIFERVLLINAAVSMFLQKPIFGVGLNNFLILLPKTIDLKAISYIIQPVHSLYFLVLSETGMIGLFALLVLISVSLFKTVKKGKPSLFFSLVALALLGLGDHYMFTLQQTQVLATTLLALSFV